MAQHPQAGPSTRSASKEAAGSASPRLQPKGPKKVSLGGYKVATVAVISPKAEYVNPFTGETTVEVSPSVESDARAQEKRAAKALALDRLRAKAGVERADLVETPANRPLLERALARVADPKRIGA